MSPCRYHYHHLTWFSIALRFLGSLTTVSCSSAIFFIFPSMSIFCSRPRTWLRSSRTVSSFPWRLASSEALAEWMAVTQFSRSVWLLAWKGKEFRFDEAAKPIFPLQAEFRDAIPDKAPKIANALLLYYSIIHHNKIIGWQAGLCWINKGKRD